MTKKKPIRDKYDIIDKTIALIIMTTHTNDRKTGVTVTVNELVTSVKKYLNGMTVTFNEVKVRLLSWSKRGWGGMLNNIFHLSKKGRGNLGWMAKALAA